MHCYYWVQFRWLTQKCETETKLILQVLSFFSWWVILQFYQCGLSNHFCIVSYPQSVVFAECRIRRVSYPQSVVFVECRIRRASYPQSVVSVECRIRRVSYPQSVVSVECRTHRVSYSHSVVSTECRIRRVSYPHSVVKQGVVSVGCHFLLIQTRMTKSIIEIKGK